jgi:hypothetical protein
VIFKKGGNNMLISVKIKKVIIKEINAQKSLLKALENQERDYEEDYTNVKEITNRRINNYRSFVEEDEE